MQMDDIAEGASGVRLAANNEPSWGIEELSAWMSLPVKIHNYSREDNLLKK
jgi:hypothetical protein